MLVRHQLTSSAKKVEAWKNFWNLVIQQNRRGWMRSVVCSDEEAEQDEKAGPEDNSEETGQG